MENNCIDELKKAIKNSENICVFTGAGISCPSGIPDFRSADGLYNSDDKSGFSPEEIVSHSFFANRTADFFDFYKSKMIYPDAKPNIAHRYFADLEKEKKVTVVTQNIDGLHQTAGSTAVAELHGSVHRNYCTKCGKFFDAEFIKNSNGIPKCVCGCIIKPDVVLYEEGLNEIVVNNAVKYISSADLLIVVGTSLKVYPAASFLRYFIGDTVALINKSETDFDSNANIVINDDIAKVVSELIK